MTGRRLFWATTGLIVCWTLVPTLLSYGWGFQDYYQDWASARNWWEGIAVYSPHCQTVPRYLGVDFERLPEGKIYSIVATVKVNAHPPSSVLFYLPFALLPYKLSYLTWSLFSITCLALAVTILLRELDLVLSPLAWAVIGFSGFVVGPLFEQMFFGQSNTLTLLLLVLAWQAHRRDRPVWEGCCLGAAVALKLYPLMMLVVPLGGRRWRCLGATTATIILFVGLTIGLFGGSIWNDYARLGMPEAVAWSDLWANASLSAFWRKLFLSQNKGIPVAVVSPAGYWIGYLVSTAVIGLTTLWLGLRNRAGNGDRFFSVAASSMMLLSPTCWPHYFLTAILPLALLWQDTRESVRGRRIVAVCFLLLFIPTGIYVGLCDKWCDVDSQLVGPLATLTAMAVQTYALIVLWLLAVMNTLGKFGGQQANARPNERTMGEPGLAA